MREVKSLQFSIRNPRMSRTTRGNQGKDLRASKAANKFAMSLFSHTYTLPWMRLKPNRLSVAPISE